jgi:hypothetical protein
MVKLSLPSWDKDKSQLQAGTSFTPTLTGRVKSASLPSTPSVFRRLRSPDSATSQAQAADQHPLMILRLSSPSFLDSVVHDGSSDNPLYVIDTVDTVTKIRRSDPKGFVNIARVRWPKEPGRSMSRRSKDLTGVEVAFGKGQWRPADDFMGYSYSSLSRSVLPLGYCTIHRIADCWTRFFQLPQVLHSSSQAQLEMETFWCALCRTSFDNRIIAIPTCPHILFRFVSARRRLSGVRSPSWSRVYSERHHR